MIRKIALNCVYSLLKLQQFDLIFLFFASSLLSIYRKFFILEQEERKKKEQWKKSAIVHFFFAWIPENSRHQTLEAIAVDIPWNRTCHLRCKQVVTMSKTILNLEYRILVNNLNSSHFSPFLFCAKILNEHPFSFSLWAEVSFDRNLNDSICILVWCLFT